MAGAAASGSSARSTPPSATPDLLERARNAGEISQYQADLFLAYAFTDYERVPARFKSSVGWHGTLPLLGLRRRVQAMPSSPQRENLIELLANDQSTSCSDVSAGPNRTTSPHYLIDYSTIGGGLTLASYVNSLEAAWTKTINTFGWAAPPMHPAAGGKYHVTLAALSGGLYGFVSPAGTYAGFATDNPNTSWADSGAYATCMVVNSDFSGFASPAQASLDATTAHELNHSVQFGMGALNKPGVSMLAEAGATWMEDEVFDSANDNYAYLWPSFSTGIAHYTDSPYPYWITLRGLTERFGTGVADGGEQVMQDFWEAVSKGTPVFAALNGALMRKGISLGGAYHDYAIAVRFLKTCGVAARLPTCFEESDGYTARRGAPDYSKYGGTIASRGQTYFGQLPDGYTANWVSLPLGSEPYTVTLNNTAQGGALRATAVCDTGTKLLTIPMDTVVTASGSATLGPIHPGSCLRHAAVITNQAESSTGTGRTYNLRVDSHVASDVAVNVSTSGAGSGVVISNPAGIDCGTACSSQFPANGGAELVANAAAGSVFTGWGGACEGELSTTCTLDLYSQTSVSATFAPERTLDVRVAGTGSGSVVGDDGKLACETDCTGKFAQGAAVTLTAQPKPGSRFAGWEEHCSGTGTCNLTIDENSSVTARFTDITAPSVPSLPALAPFQTNRRIALSWTASTDAQSGVAAYAVQRRVAPQGGAFGPWQLVGRFTGTRAAVSLDHGTTYCFRVSAINGEGVASRASDGRCTSLPLDDRSLSSAGGWQRSAGVGHFAGTFSQSSSKGATLSRRVTAKRVVLVAMRCSGCGKVAVFWGTRLLREVPLNATQAQKLQLIPVVTFGSVQTGTLKIKIVSTRKRVVIDGLGASRT